MTQCITCKNQHNEKYCPNCGEKAGTKKITLTSITKEALTTLTDMDKGFLYNVKMLIRNPKKIILDYISGKRKGIMNPISFLIIALSIYLISETTFWTSSGTKENVDSSTLNHRAYKMGVSFGKFLFTYFKYFFIFLTILLANSTKLLFQRFNYIEHLAINFFISGLSVLLSTFLFVALGIPLIFNPLLYGGICFLTFRVFQTESNKSEIWILTTASFFVFIIQLIVSVVTISFLVE